MNLIIARQTNNIHSLYLLVSYTARLKFGRKIRASLYYMVLSKYSWFLVLALYSSFSFTADYQLTGGTNALQSSLRAWLPELPPDSLYNHHGIQQRIRKALNSGANALGYYEANFDILITSQKVTIKITQGDPIKVKQISVVIDGVEMNNALNSLNFTTIIEPGKTFQHDTYQSFKDELLTHYINQGYITADWIQSHVDINIKNHSANIILEISTGPLFQFGHIHYVGDSLSIDLLNRIANVQSGDSYSISNLNRIYVNLVSSGYFDSVILTPRDANLTEKSVDIDIELTHKAAASILTGLGAATDTGARFTIGLAVPRLNNAGHQFQSEIIASESKKTFNLSYLIPLEQPLNEQFEMDMGWQEEIIHSDTTNLWVFGVQRHWLTRSGVGNTLMSRWEVESHRSSGITSKSNLIWFGGSRLMQSHNPMKQRLLLQSEATSTTLGSDANLLRLLGRYQNFVSKNKHSLLSRLETGAIRDLDNNQVTEPQKYITGGDQTIRGYGYNTLGVTGQNNTVLGGTNLLVTSIEYGYSLNNDWQLATFIDMGDAFDEKINIRTGLGAGIRRMIPGGVIMFDLATPSRELKPRIHFSVGIQF